MLQVFFGNDVIKVRQAALNAIDIVSQNGATLVTIDENNYEVGIITDAIGGTSLFGGEQVYLIDTPSTDEVMFEDVINNLASFQESNNLFVLIEGAMLAPEKKLFTKYAANIQEFKAETEVRFNSFALADALASRDKKTLWLLLHEATLSGLALEELIGTLWWQLKSMRLAAVTQNASEAGMKDFPYNKAKRALNKFKPGEVEALSHSLLSLQHDSRLGKRDLDLALERWVLGL